MFKNTVKTFTLLGGLGGFMVLIGSLLGGTGGLVIGLLFGLVMVGGTYWMSDKLAVRAAHAREVQPGELDWLRADLEALATRDKMRTPRLFISAGAQPSAFATGRNEATAWCAPPRACSARSTATRYAESSRTSSPTSSTATS